MPITGNCQLRRNNDIPSFLGFFPSPSQLNYNREDFYDKKRNPSRVGNDIEIIHESEILYVCLPPFGWCNIFSAIGNLEA